MRKLHRVYADKRIKKGKRGALGKAKVPLPRTSVPDPKTKAFRVGIWDLGAWVGYLDDILKKWNACQTAVRFQVVYLSVPVQLTQGGERTLSIARKHISKSTLSRNRDDLKNNLHVDELFPIATRIKDSLNYDQLVSITPLMVAFNEGKELKWNYFSVSEDGVIFISAFGVRDFALHAKRSFEAAIAMLILAQVFMDWCDFDSHEETRGCLFDFNEDRVSIVKGLRKMEIEPECLLKISPKLRAPAKRMLEALKEYHR